VDSPKDNRGDRRALRRRDPKALATILIGQLMAYRSSTVYAPSTSKLDRFLADEVFPRLEAELDVRKVVVAKWTKPGPTVGQLVDEIHRQLEIEQSPDDPRKPTAVLEEVLRRAERRSDRPILIVLYQLENLLNKDLLPADAMKFVDALSRMASMPIRGLQLILGVKEEDLGAFRELLRGRWRLLANDIRIRPSGKKWFIPLPIGATTAVASSPVAAGAIAVGGKAGIAALAGFSGLGMGAVVSGAILTNNPKLERCQRQLAEIQQQTCPECPELPVVAPPIPEEPPPPEPEEFETTEDPEVLVLDESSTGEETTEDPQVAAKVDMCLASRRDNNCAQCVKTECCSKLEACKSRRWRNCVLKKRIGQDSCLPAQLEKRCRGLALCALEYECRASCFGN